MLQSIQQYGLCLHPHCLIPSAVRQPWLALGATSMSQPRFAADCAADGKVPHQPRMAIGAVRALLLPARPQVTSATDDHSAIYCNQYAKQI